MNKAAILVSDAILGQSGGTVIINNKAYLLKAPTIEILSRLIRPLARIDLKEEITIESITAQAENIAEAIAIAWLGDNREWKKQLPAVKKELAKATVEELRDAMELLVSLIIPKDFFVCATLGREVAAIAARPASKETTP